MTANDPADASTDYLVLSRGQWDREAAPEAIQAAIDAFYPWLDAHIAAGRMKTGERLARAGATVSRKAVVVDESSLVAVSQDNYSPAAHLTVTKLSVDSLTPGGSIRVN